MKLFCAAAGVPPTAFAMTLNVCPRRRRATICSSRLAASALACGVKRSPPCRFRFGSPSGVEEISCSMVLAPVARYFGFFRDDLRLQFLKPGIRTHAFEGIVPANLAIAHLTLQNF